MAPFRVRDIVAPASCAPNIEHQGRVRHGKSAPQPICVSGTFLPFLGTDSVDIVFGIGWKWNPLAFAAGEQKFERVSE